MNKSSPIILFCLIFLFQGIADSALGRPRNIEELAQILLQVQPIPLPTAITSIYRPRYDEGKDADLKLTADEPVFVAMLPDGPRVYPQQYMVWHQVVNEVINDEAFAITYCPITGTLLAFNATIDNQNLIFDVEGHNTKDGFYGFLYDGNSVLMDRNTGSLWLQETGIAFEGPLAGKGMATIPVYWTTWGAVKRVFPTAPVLARPKGRRPYGRDPYGNYLRSDTYYDNDILAYPVHRSDRRFPKKAPMYCIELDNLLCAIQISYVKERGAVNFFLGPYPLLAVYDPTLEVVRIFNRQIWDDPFLFIIRNGQLTDMTTNTIWSISTGEAISGNMKGASMRQYFGHYSMWFAWYDINPETFYIPGPGEVSETLLKTAPPGLDEQGRPDNSLLPFDPKKLPGSPKW